MKNSARHWQFKSFLVTSGVIFSLVGTTYAVDLTPQQQLGKKIFFDKNLSANMNQACAACHSPASGWTGPEAAINEHGAVYEGSIAGRFGNRKPPSSAYATQSPILHLSKQAGGTFIGGNFWDGRATGERLGNPSAEQAQGPFLNPLEQALPSASDVVSRICASSYSNSFKEICGADACESANVNAAYDCVGISVAAFEASPEVNQFSSKYDAVVAGKAKFTKQEKEGLNLFLGKAKCSKCHVVTPKGQQALFTDYTFDNIGVPKNPENPFYSEPEFNKLGAAFIDEGLGGFLASQTAHPEWTDLAKANEGKFKVPTLRNVDKWDSTLGEKHKAYSHNGFFKSLDGIVHFYNTRDVLPVCQGSFITEAVALASNCWPLPELALNMNTKEVGNLGLSSDEEAALVAFMKTLSDGFTP